MEKTSEWIPVEKMRPTQEWLREHGYRPDLVLVTQNDSHDASNWEPVPWDIEHEKYWGWEGWLAIPAADAETIDQTGAPSGGSAVTPPEAKLADYLQAIREPGVPPIWESLPLVGAVTPQIIRRVPGARYILSLDDDDKNIPPAQLEDCRQELAEWWEGDSPFVIVRHPLTVEVIVEPEVSDD